ncbi:CAP10 domain-containing protein [Mycena indigotica]|uniref:CAP10 domain-containing protein n=1 Tax=Mycena indigotica TaxID=2126181 RepID=A0A8H6S068_9AGAR|nr:CAP10 domain-containing protein [Mycena indigotica]KAF7290524.1 CAP10 domain-containing protein [Mycena indigotica]
MADSTCKLPQLNNTDTQPRPTPFIVARPDIPLDFDPLSIAARASAQRALDSLLSKQSSTLNEAIARYTLKTRRPPPPNYSEWFNFAKNSSCLIDNYDQIHRDFEPFYQLAKKHPKWFREAVDQGSELFLRETQDLRPKRQAAYGLAAIAFKDKKLVLPPYQPTTYAKDIPQHLFKITSLMPDLTFLLNGRDEPRVVFDTRQPGALEKIDPSADLMPFHLTPSPTGPFFRNQPGCNVSSRGHGFVHDDSELVSFLTSSASSDFTTSLWPLFSMAKLTCFADILFPGQYYYRMSRWSPKIGANDIPWADKKPILYWRGGSTGGRILSTPTTSNHHSFPRFRLLKLASNHSDIMDIKMTGFAQEYCKTEDGCRFSPIIIEYSIFGPKASRRDVLGYKYLFDIDGNTFSGRFLGLLRSGSLVFKATVYQEFFNDWIRPYEHFIPVKYDLSDLVHKLQWAIDHEQEARRIQETGKLFADKVMTDAQNDCYMSLLLLEWARLYNYEATSL